MSAAHIRICPRCGYSVEGQLPLIRALKLFEVIAQRLRIVPDRLGHRNRDRTMVEKRLVAAWVLRSKKVRERDIAVLLDRNQSTVSLGLTRLRRELAGENASAWQRLIDLAAND